MRKITAEMVDWDLYKENVLQDIANENLWLLGGSNFAEDNIASLAEELDLINDEDYDTLLNMYDDDVWVHYLK